MPAMNTGKYIIATLILLMSWIAPPNWERVTAKTSFAMGGHVAIKRFKSPHHNNENKNQEILTLPARFKKHVRPYSVMLDGKGEPGLPLSIGTKIGLMTRSQNNSGTNTETMRLRNACGDLAAKYPLINAKPIVLKYRTVFTYNFHGQAVSKSTKCVSKIVAISTNFALSR